MKAYVYFDLDKVTDNWHPEGGLLIITDDDPLYEWDKYVANKIKEELLKPPWSITNSAKELAEWRQETEVDLRQTYRDTLPKSDLEFNTDHDTAQVVVFPNSGCC